MKAVTDNLVCCEAKVVEKSVADSGGSEHRLSNLDGIRGIAIALVVICHSGDLRISNGLGHSFLWKLYWHVSMSLWVGVDIFFVLSGFLITSILIKTRKSKNYYSGFYGRRVLRILPMFVVVLLMVGSFLIWKGQCTVWQCLVLLFSLGNWLIIGNHEIPPLTHFWSLAVEEQFYLVWPFVARTLTPAAIFGFCVGLFLTAGLLRAVLAILGTYVYVIYKITPAHWDGLALGALLACLPALPSLEQWFVRSIRKLVLVSAICLGALFVYNGFGLYCFSPLCLALGLPFVDILALGLVFSALQVKRGLFHRVLNAYPLQWLGRYSYSIYLIHYPCFCITNWAIGDRKSFFLNFVIAVALYFVTPLLLARLAWSAIEQPFMNLKSRFKPVFGVTPCNK